MPVQSDKSAAHQLAQKQYEFNSAKPLNLTKCTREEILKYFINTYDLDEGIFSGLREEEYFYKCPDRLRLPLVFYLAHTATLYVNKMLMAGLIKERVNRHFETTFETGVDEMSWDDTENYRMGGAFKWPSLKEVMEYRQTVRELVTKVIETAPLELPVTHDHPWWSVFMGMEHERIHLETSSVLIRQLPSEFLTRPKNWKYAPVQAAEPAGPNGMVKMPSRSVTFGKPRDFPTYGWDNEYGMETMDVPEFEASKYKVTNGEFLEFVESGGYQQRDLWTDEGWKWVKYRQAQHPSFWVCDEGCKSGCGSVLATYSHCKISYNGTSDDNRRTKYKYRAIYDVISMPFDWPVDVNYHEAKAYCKWKGPEYRLPTEAETQCIRGDEPPSTKFECDPICRDDLQANINLAYGSSSPVNLYPPNAAGFYDSYGNVWEWVEDHFNGLPGFKTSYLYDDFSSPCFDGLHTMMLGGSWISTGDEASRFSRFSFRRHFFQHLGFRLVRGSKHTPVRLCNADVFILGAGTMDNPVTVQNPRSDCLCPSTNKHMDYDEVDVCKKLLTEDRGKSVEYGKPLVEFCSGLVKKHSVTTNTVFVFGCGGGYTSFRLSNFFKKVVGIDFSGRLIDAAMQFQEKGEMVWKVDGEKEWKLRLPDDIKFNSVTFKQMTWVPNELEGANFILFEFLDLLMEPKGWLLKLWECVSSRGVVVFSASECWSAPALQEHIGEWFDLLEDTHICNKRVSAWQLKPGY